jgi:histidinol-phosphate aminotransferase
MTDLETLVRPNIRALIPYSSARGESGATEGIFLDANENPYGTLNRYPDPLQKELREKISELKQIKTDNIFLGNGSDEIIDLCFRIFCEPKKDKAVTFTPTYGMYEVSAAINDVQLIQIPLNSNFQVGTDKMDGLLTDKRVKLLFVCSPNNPTGNSIDALEDLVRQFNGIVVVDEAYIDFSPKASLVAKLEKYPNLIVIQTLSKAWGLAAARIGMAFASIQLIKLLNRVKPPYNVSAINQQAALAMLNKSDLFAQQVKQILSEKEKLVSALEKLDIVKRIYASETNFILVEFSNATHIYDQLAAKSIIVRNRHSAIPNCLRITIGQASENEQLIEILKKSKP